MTPIKPSPDLLIITAVIAGAGYFVWRLDRAWDYDNNKEKNDDNAKISRA